MTHSLIITDVNDCYRYTGRVNFTDLSIIASETAIKSSVIICKLLDYLAAFDGAITLYTVQYTTMKTKGYKDSNDDVKLESFSTEDAGKNNVESINYAQKHDVQREAGNGHGNSTVSYTHLTLPTILRV